MDGWLIKAHSVRCVLSSLRPRDGGGDAKSGPLPPPFRSVCLADVATELLCARAVSGSTLLLKDVARAPFCAPFILSCLLRLSRHPPQLAASGPSSDPPPHHGGVHSFHRRILSLSVSLSSPRQNSASSRQVTAPSRRRVSPLHSLGLPQSGPPCPLLRSGTSSAPRTRRLTGLCLPARALMLMSLSSACTVSR